MERKIHFGADVKMNDDGPGWLEGYGSTFGNTDRDGDTIAKGAFAASIPNFIRDGFMPVGHNWTGLAVATIEEAREDDHGLFLRAQFHSTPEAQNARIVARERMERGKSVGLSIGFMVPEGESARRDDGVRVIKRAELYEVSIVTVPANALATTTAIKGDRERLQEVEARLLADAPTIAHRYGELVALEAKQGRALSQSRIDRILADADALDRVIAAATQTRDNLRALIAEADPVDDGTKAAALAAVIEAELIMARLNGVATEVTR